MLGRIKLALSNTRKDRDVELLAPNEVLVRICPATGHPVLVCHDGQGQCSCLHYNAGADNLWKDNDSRAINADIIRWAGEFETKYAGADWNEEDYFLTIDRFYEEKTSNL